MASQCRGWLLPCVRAVKTTRLCPANAVHPCKGWGTTIGTALNQAKAQLVEAQDILQGQNVTVLRDTAASTMQSTKFSQT